MKVAFVALIALAMASGAAAQGCSGFATISMSYTSVAAGGDCLWSLGENAQSLKLCAAGTQPVGSYFGPTCTCTAPAAQGAACSATIPCKTMDATGVFATGLSCVDATCQLQQRWIGDSCNANTDCAHYSADMANGVTCANNVCTTTGAVGDDCSTGLVVCPAGAECVTADSASTCMALLASGGDCSTGRTCVPGTASLTSGNTCTCTNLYTLANGAAAGHNSNLCMSMNTDSDGNCAAPASGDGTTAVGAECTDDSACTTDLCMCTGSNVGSCHAALPAGPAPLAPAQALAACMRTSGCFTDTTTALEGTCGNMACTSEATDKSCNGMMQTGGDNFVNMLNTLYSVGIPSQIPAECDGAAQVVASLMAMVAVAVAALRNL